MNRPPRIPLVNGLWLFAVAVLAIAVLSVAAPVGAESTRAVVARTDAHVRAAQACQRSTDRDRPATPTRRLYSSTESMPFRQWAFKLWRGRSHRACGKMNWLNAVPPRAIRYVFARIGQQAIALTVAGREAGGGDIWAHPFCTRVDNGVGFLGCFQEGSYARSTFGYGPTALDQAWSAFRYVRHDGGWCGGWAATAPGC